MTDVDNWADDVMNRKHHAEFMTTYIEQRIAEPVSSLTIALDAEWGAGKTFFVNRWAKDLEQKKRGVIQFDAWKNDTASDPVLGFMSELQSGMNALRNRVPKSSVALNSIIATTKSLGASVRKAIIPTAGALAAGLAKKASGVAASEILEAIKDADFDITLDIDGAASATTAQLDKALDVFFKKTLEDHRARGKATVAFRLALEKLVIQLREADAIEGPLYVFIDELDRCRPDYAIRLLEGIKHLFSVPGAVFVVSTNLGQLARSVQAVYGTNFDGDTYLQRFFDFESVLPAPNHLEYARLLCANDSVLAKRKKSFDFGLQDLPDRDADPVSVVFSFIATAFELPPRTQQRVFLSATAAISALPQGYKPALLWIFFLSALRHTNRTAFGKVGVHAMNEIEFQDLCNQIGKIRSTIIRSHKLNSSRSGYDEVQHSLSKVLAVYYRSSVMEVNTLMERVQRSEYPDSLARHHLQHSDRKGDGRITMLSEYIELINSAGLLG